MGASLLMHMMCFTPLLLWRSCSGRMRTGPTTSLQAAGKKLPPPRDTSLALCGRWSGCCRLTAVIIAAYRFLTSWMYIQALFRHAGLSWCLSSALTLGGDSHRGGGGDFFEEPHLCCSPTSSDGPLSSPVRPWSAAPVGHTPQGSSTSGESG